RQSTGAEDVVRAQLHAGRLARYGEADGERGPPLRVQRASLRCRRSDAHLRSDDAAAAASWCRWCVAIGAARRRQRCRAASGRELGSDRKRTLAPARRLRHLLRFRNAHREFCPVLQPAVLLAAAVLPRRTAAVALESVSRRTRVL